jgi:hypothetical protein
MCLQTAKIILAMRFAPESCQPPPSHEEKSAPPNKKGGEAPKGACQPCPRSSDKRHRLPMPCARLRATLGGAPAFRRFTAAELE